LEPTWGIDSTSTQSRPEKEVSRQKFDTLRANGLVDESGARKTFEEVIFKWDPARETPEYGFPKGRRDTLMKQSMIVPFVKLYRRQGFKETILN
jgi:hypothetical protein